MILTCKLTHLEKNNIFFSSFTIIFKFDLLAVFVRSLCLTSGAQVLSRMYAMMSPGPPVLATHDEVLLQMVFA